MRQNMVDSDVFLTRHGARIDKEDRHSKRASEFLHFSHLPKKSSPGSPESPKHGAYGAKKDSTTGRLPAPVAPGIGFPRRDTIAGTTRSCRPQGTWELRSWRPSVTSCTKRGASPWQIWEGFHVGSIFLCPKTSESKFGVIWVCLKIVYPYTQWLMIIIPIEWL